MESSKVGHVVPISATKDVSFESSCEAALEILTGLCSDRTVLTEIGPDVIEREDKDQTYHTASLWEP